MFRQEIALTAMRAPDETDFTEKLNSICKLFGILVDMKGGVKKYLQFHSSDIWTFLLTVSGVHI